MKTCWPQIVLAAALLVGSDAQSRESVVRTYYSCPQAYARMPLAQLEEAIFGEYPDHDDCLSRSLAVFREGALATVNRLLDSDSGRAHMVARNSLYWLDDEAIEALPALIKLHRKKTSIFATQAPDHMLSMGMASILADIMRFGKQSPLVDDYLLEIMRNTTLPVSLRSNTFSSFWEHTSDNHALRVQVVPELLAMEILEGRELKTVADFLITMRPSASIIGPALRESLWRPHADVMVEAFIAFHDHDEAVPYLINRMGAVAGYPVNHQVASAFKKWVAPAIIDRHLGQAAANASQLPSVVFLMNNGLNSASAERVLVEVLAEPATFERAARAFIAIDRPVPLAWNTLLARLQDERRGQEAARSLILRALAHTGGGVQIPRPALIDAMGRELALMRRYRTASERDACTGESCKRVDCTATDLLARFSRPHAAEMPALRKAYQEAESDVYPACLNALATLIARRDDRTSATFLLRRLLENRSLPRAFELGDVLARQIDPLLPSIASSIDALPPAKKLVLERMLVNSAAMAFTEAYRQRVVPLLFAQAMGKDASAPVVKASPDSQSHQGAAPRRADAVPLTRGGLAVRRLGQLATRNAENSVVLVTVAAGAHVEAGEEAMDALFMWRSRERFVKFVRHEAIVSQLAVATDKLAKTRLERLHQRYRLTRQDRHEEFEGESRGFR